MKSYDVIVIGSGPGGYIAAIRAAQLGFKTAIVEKYNTLGGTCLNVGCIPSKALLDSSEHYYNLIHNFETHGVFAENPSFDLSVMISRKNTVVEQTTNGIKFLMDKNKIEVFHATGSFKDATHILLTKNEGSTEEIEGKNIIIATGSKPSNLPFITLDKEKIITSTEALNLPKVPKTLLVIGGGVIGLELGSVYQRLGSKVSVIEYAENIIPTMDVDLSKELRKVLKKEGMEFYTSHQVQAVSNEGEYVKVVAKDKMGKEVIFEGEYCLVAVGRKPYTDGLGLENVGVEVDEKGRIKTNEYLQSNISNIYAIGDVVAGAMLAHKAEEEGVFVAERLAGQKPHINYNLIPGVVYTWPEVASVGKTELQLREAGVDFKIGKFPMRALGRARASGDIEGFVKVLADAKTDEILGMHIIGARGADLIAECVTAMEYRASAQDVAMMSHAHPTYSEAIKEACLDAFDKKPLNM